MENIGSMIISFIWFMVQLAEIKRLLEQMKPELARKFGARSFGLFGSVVRADFTGSSDFDIILDFDQPVNMEFIDWLIIWRNV